MVEGPEEIQGREPDCSAEESQDLQEDHEEDLDACRWEMLWAVGADRILCIVSSSTFAFVRRYSAPMFKTRHVLRTREENVRPTIG